MIPKRILSDIFKDREELIDTVFKHLKSVSGSNKHEYFKDRHQESIVKLFSGIEKVLEKKITNKDAQWTNLLRLFHPVWKDFSESRINHYQQLEIIINCKKVILEKSTSLQLENGLNNSFKYFIGDLTDLLLLDRSRECAKYSLRKSNRDKQIIEDLKLVKNDLQKQLDLIYQIIRNTPMGFAGCDAKLNVKIWNRIAESLTGYEQSNIIGKSILEIFTPPSQAVIQNQLSDSMHRRKRMKLNIQTRDGGIFNAYILVSRLRSEIKQKVKYIINIVDLSKEEQLKSQLEKIEQLGAIARLSDAIMHDVRNPINSLALNIDVLTQQLSEKLSSANETRTIIEKVNRQISNLTQSLNRYVGYSRITELKLEPIDLNKTLSEVILDMHHHIVEKQITLKFHRSKIPLMINGDWTQLIRVFRNLIDNAVDAIVAKGTIDIITRKRNQNITISVVDNGRGIRSENFANVFKPYFTTKEKGSGLGLFIVREIVRAHHGRVYCTSSDAKGTRFTVSIPAIVNSN
jgi:PAS domain S-box-containing protein